MGIGEWLFAGFILIIGAVGLIGGLLVVIGSLFEGMPTKDYKPGQYTKKK